MLYSYLIPWWRSDIGPREDTPKVCRDDAERHGTWFGGLDIHKKPTPLKGKFEVLLLDFSCAATGHGQR